VLSREATGGLPDESLISSSVAIKISSENHLDDERNKNALLQTNSDCSFFSIRNKRNSNTVVLFGFSLKFASECNGIILPTTSFGWDCAG